MLTQCYATVVPVPKCRNPSLCDYRPISILPAASKIFEKLVYEKYVKDKVRNVVSREQFAFVPGAGTGTTCALVRVTNRLLGFLDPESGAVRLLFIDFTKAFDQLPFAVTLNHFANAGFSRGFVVWLYSYLHNRYQRVRLRGEHSAWIPVVSGVPQGSILGPVLFAVVVDALKCLHSNSYLVKFADDVTIIHTVRKSDEDQLQSELDHVMQWSRSVGLKVNSAKTKTMVCCTKSGLANKLRHLYNGPQLIEQVQAFKLLGVTLADNFRWNQHVTNVVRVASQRLYGLRRPRGWIADKVCLWRIYFALIRSVLAYGFPAVCNMTRRLQAQLLRVEQRAVAIIGSRPPVALDEFLLQQCRTLASAIESPAHRLHDLIRIVEKGYTLRSRPRRAPLSRTTRFKNSFIMYL